LVSTIPNMAVKIQESLCPTLEAMISTQSGILRRIEGRVRRCVNIGQKQEVPTVLSS
jgi:C4-type Zn-finger protein